MENPVKMDDLGGTPNQIFGNIHMANLMARTFFSV